MSANYKIFWSDLNDEAKERLANLPYEIEKGEELNVTYINDIDELVFEPEVLVLEDVLEDYNEDDEDTLTEMLYNLDQEEDLNSDEDEDN